MKSTLTLSLLLYAGILCGQSFDALRQRLDSILQKYEIPGAQVAVVDKDSILWMHNFGYADVAAQKPVSDQTMFRIGSITKSFVAVSAMMLVEEGRLSLDDKLKDLAPEVPYANPWEETHPIRLVNLLEHTTGFDDMHMKEYATQGEGWTTLQGLQFHPDSKVSRWQPGMHMSYCNSGPPITAYCIEKKTGKTIEDFIAERIFRPLGMPHSSLLYTDYVKEHLSKEYMGRENAEAPYWHIISRAAGAINSNAVEMSNYLRFYLNRGSVDSLALLKSASIDRIEHPASTLAAKAGVTEGYGLHIGNGNYRGVGVFGHSGGMTGFLAMLRYAPEKNRGYILLVNKANGGFSPLNDALTQFITDPDNQWKAPEHVKGTFNPEIPGYYRSATSRNQVLRFMEWPLAAEQITEQDGLLFHKPLFQVPAPVNVIKPDLLQRYMPSGAGVLMALVKDDQGRTLMQQPNISYNAVKTTAAGVWIPIVLAGFSQLMILLTIFSALIWIPVALFSRHRIGFRRARIYPLLAALSWVGFVLLIVLAQTQGDVINNLGRPTFWSVGMFLFSLFFPLFSLLAVYYNAVSFTKPINKWSRGFFTLSSLSCLLVTAYLFYWGAVGLRIWVY